MESHQIANPVHEITPHDGVDLEARAIDLNREINSGSRTPSNASTSNHPTSNNGRLALLHHSERHPEKAKPPITANKR